MRLYTSSTVLPTIIFLFVSCTASPDTRPLDEAEPEAVDEVGDSAQATVVTSADTIIRLDPNAEDLEVWKDRDISEDPPREPGPITTFGPLTFFGLPIAMTVEDLVAG